MSRGEDWLTHLAANTVANVVEVRVAFEVRIGHTSFDHGMLDCEVVDVDHKSQAFIDAHGHHIHLRQHDGQHKNDT